MCVSNVLSSKAADPLEINNVTAKKTLRTGFRISLSSGYELETIEGLAGFVCDASVNS